MYRFGTLSLPVGGLRGNNMDQPPAPQCQFCHASFATKGTYGRHLDSKRGDAQHPADAVDSLRAGVVRRGRKPEKSEPGPSSTAENSSSAHRERSSGPKKSARSAVSKKYNSGAAVSERNRQRRRHRDMRIKASLQAAQWFLDRLERGQTKETTEPKAKETKEAKEAKVTKELTKESDEAKKSEKSTDEKSDLETTTGKPETEKSVEEGFPSVVAAVVPPAQWPRLGTVPGEEQFAVALQHPRPGPARLYSLYAQWKALAPEQQAREWREAQDRAVRRHLGRTSLEEISRAGELVRARQQQLYEEYASGMMGMIVSDSEKE